MAQLSITMEGLFGLTWPEWKSLVLNVENLGFVNLYLSDHFMLPALPAYPSLEMVVALGYLADHTERVRFGPMVSPLSIRDPVMLARQAAALDELSGGRMILGLGTGHLQLEHEMFGYHLGDMATRFARFEEGLAVITGLLRSDEPFSFDGEFYRLREAVLPPPRRPGGPSIMIGGSGPKRTLPLVARFADVWNAQFVTPEALAERMSLLDALLVEAGRRPDDVLRTMTLEVVCWRSPDEIAMRVRRNRRYPAFRDQSDHEIIDTLRAWPAAVIGTPEQVISQIRAFEAVGVSEIVLRWLDASDIDGLELLASDVLPAFTA